jgi:lambda family phage portal protein
MNMLDRAIGWFSPGAGLRRQMQRELLGDAAGQRSYAAGRVDRQSQGWIATGASQNEVLSGASRTLTNRSRDLVRNNPWAVSALRRLPASIIGSGVTASLQMKKGRARDAVQSDWDWFREEGNALGTASWDADLALLVRTIVEAGDGLIVWESTPAKANLQVPLRWRMLPPEYIDRTRTNGALHGNAIVNGVEVNEDGRVVAYWLYDRHPMDTLYGRPVESRRVDAKHVDLIFEPLWLGQRRGVPWLAPVALSADELQQYDTAALWKARMAASYGIVRKLPAPPSQSSMAAPKKDAQGRPVSRIAPGMELIAKDGEEISSLQPPRDDNFEVFWRTRLYAIAAGLGMPHASLTGDLRQANYSSLREGKLLFWELLDVWQWHMVHDKVLRSVWRRFGIARYAAGRTQGGILPAVKWGFPKRAWTDPLKEISALREEMDLGLTTWPDAVAARGEDAETQLAEIMEWAQRLVDAGMPVGRGRISREAAEASAALTKEADADEAPANQQQ